MPHQEPFSKKVIEVATREAANAPTPESRGNIDQLSTMSVDGLVAVIGHDAQMATQVVIRRPDAVGEIMQQALATRPATAMLVLATLRHEFLRHNGFSHQASAWIRSVMRVTGPGAEEVKIAMQAIIDESHAEQARNNTPLHQSFAKVDGLNNRMELAKQDPQTGKLFANFFDRPADVVAQLVADQADPKLLEKHLSVLIQLMEQAPEAGRGVLAALDTLRDPSMSEFKQKIIGRLSRQGGDTDHGEQRKQKGQSGTAEDRNETPHQVASAATEIFDSLATLSKLSEKLTNASKALSAAEGTAKIVKGATAYRKDSLVGAITAVEGAMTVAALFSSKIKAIKQAYSVGKGTAQIQLAYNDIDAHMKFKEGRHDLAQAVADFAAGVHELVPDVKPKFGAVKYVLTKSIALGHYCDKRAKERGAFHDADGKEQMGWEWAADQGIAFQQWVGEMTGEYELASNLGYVASVLAGMYAGGRVFVDTASEAGSTAGKGMAAGHRKLEYATSVFAVATASSFSVCFPRSGPPFKLFGRSSRECPS